MYVVARVVAGKVMARGGWVAGGPDGLNTGATGQPQGRRRRLTGRCPSAFMLGRPRSTKGRLTCMRPGHGLRWRAQPQRCWNRRISAASRPPSLPGPCPRPNLLTESPRVLGVAHGPRHVAAAPRDRTRRDEMALAVAGLLGCVAELHVQPGNGGPAVGRADDGRVQAGENQQVCSDWLTIQRQRRRRRAAPPSRHER